MVADSHQEEFYTVTSAQIALEWLSIDFSNDQMARERDEWFSCILWPPSAAQQRWDRVASLTKSCWEPSRTATACSDTISKWNTKCCFFVLHFLFWIFCPFKFYIDSFRPNIFLWLNFFVWFTICIVINEFFLFGCFFFL